MGEMSNKKLFGIVVVLLIAILVLSVMPVEGKIVRKNGKNSNNADSIDKTTKNSKFRIFKRISRGIKNIPLFITPKYYVPPAKIPESPERKGPVLINEDPIGKDVPEPEPIVNADISSWEVYSSTTMDFVRPVATGDIDGDGDMDVVAGAYKVPGQVSIYENNGNVDVSTWSVYGVTITSYVISLATDDIDGDGDNDIVVGIGGANGKVSVYENTGTLDISTWPVYSVTTTKDVYSVVISDIDGDGNKDIVVGIGWSPGKVSIYRNPGAVDISTWAVYSAPTTDNVRSVAVGDVDGDGNKDVVASIGGGTNIVSVYENTGNIDISAWSVYSTTTGDDASSVAIGDIDGDGDNDIVTGILGAPGQISIYENTGTININLWTSYSKTTFENILSVAISDINNDGNSDIVAGRGLIKSQTSKYLYISIYQSDGTLNIDQWPVYSATTEDHPQSVAISDIDNDGDNDVVVGIHGSAGRVSIYYNDLI